MVGRFSRGAGTNISGRTSSRFGYSGKIYTVSRDEYDLGGMRSD